MTIILHMRIIETLIYLLGVGIIVVGFSKLPDLTTVTLAENAQLLLLIGLIIMSLSRR